jgi:hypothetical protein
MLWSILINLSLAMAGIDNQNKRARQSISKQAKLKIKKDKL